MTVGCVAVDALIVADCTAVPVGCSLGGSVVAEPVELSDDVSLGSVVSAVIGPFGVVDGFTGMLLFPKKKYTEIPASTTSTILAAVARTFVRRYHGKTAAVFSEDAGIASTFSISSGGTVRLLSVLKFTLRIVVTSVDFFEPSPAAHKERFHRIRLAAEDIGDLVHLVALDVVEIQHVAILFLEPHQRP